MEKSWSIKCKTLSKPSVTYARSLSYQVTLMLRGKSLSNILSILEFNRLIKVGIGSLWRKQSLEKRMALLLGM
jgi:hypothetical protein